MKKKHTSTQLIHIQICYINSASAIGTLSSYPLSFRLAIDDGRDRVVELGREFGLDFEVAELLPAYP